MHVVKRSITLSGYLQRRSFSISKAKLNQTQHSKLDRTTQSNENNGNSKPKGALEGIRVLDLSRILAGPFCTQILGDMGAEVIKIEHPQDGDDTRIWRPPQSEAGESAYFIACNRNKKSVTVDLKSKQGLEIIYKLAKISDVVVENFPPQKADSLGIGYQKLSSLNPRLVYASITGFGPTGPYKDRLAYDVMASAIGGLLAITGPEDGSTPVRTGVAITDICSGLYLHGAIISALYSRDRTGRGQKIDTSLLEAQIGMLSYAASNYLVGGHINKPLGTAHPSIVPYQAFHTKSGHIVIGALNDGQFVRLARLLGAEHLSSDARFTTNPDRVKNREMLISILQKILNEHSTEHWEKLLEANKVPYGPINNMKQVFEDPQVLHRKMVEEVEHPIVGKVKVVGLPVKYSETPSTIRSAPPLLGEHTKEVLGEMLGYSNDQIEELIQKKVVTQFKEEK